VQLQQRAFLPAVGTRETGKVPTVVSDAYQPNLDLAACEDEPIHIPGSIQPHGWLLAFTPTGTVTHLSANFGSVSGCDPSACIGRSVADVLPPEASLCLQDLLAWAARPEGGFVCRFPHGGGALRGFAHRAGSPPDGNHLILELEPGAAGSDRTDALQADILEFSRAADDLAGWHSMAALAARIARRSSRFDRVLVYRFDHDFNGTVVAEDGNGILPSYLGLHFPASDIPAQARELYRRNRLRLIPDATYRPVPILPACGPDAAAPLDLRQATLRSVSPLHLRYMRNMGTAASMSASLIVEDRLWGLMSFHSRDPHFVELPVRSAMEFLAQMLAGGLAARTHAERGRMLVVSQAHHDRLLAAMAAGTPPRPDILAEEPADLLALTGATGAAILTNDDCLSVGQTPCEATLRRLAAWLAGRGERTVFATDSLASLWPEAEPVAGEASGLLAASISELHPSYLMWFRPEQIRTVDWAGPPEKHGTPDQPAGLSPRTSFALWRQNLHLRASPWEPHEIEAARRLRQAIVGVVLRRAEELAGLNRELVRTNKELEAFSYSISHDLRAPFRHIVGYAEMLSEHLGGTLSATGRRYLQTIIDSAMSAGQLVDDLLQFSRLGRVSLALSRVSMTKLAEEARRSLELEHSGRNVEWRIADLPPCWGDPSLLRQAWINLLSNALKYSRGRTPAIIEITGENLSDASRYTVRDNGVGFDMAYVGKLFGVFQRLHLAEHYEGTGIGLALTRRIVERHGGSIAAHGELGRGASFTFTLPHPRAEPAPNDPHTAPKPSRGA
jgi:light-regulated signal transduction histidine kinase (bacteriophytochrome)